MDERPSEGRGPGGAGDLSTSATKAATTRCPNCSREVEAGFKFCDFCGTKLEAGPTTAAAETKKTPLFERVRSRRSQRREEATQSLQERMQPDDELSVPPIPTPSEEPLVAMPEAPKTPLIERWRMRREGSVDDAASALDEHKRADADIPIPPPTPAATSRITKAADFRTETGEPKVGVSGRLRWQEDDTTGVEDTTTIEPPPPVPSTWRRRSKQTQEAEASMGQSTLRFVLVFVLHLLIAFAFGALLLGAAAIVATLASAGRVSLLELRGLPIFIAGTTAIIVFALLRTGPRRRGSGRSTAITVFVGFLILVIAVTIAYQPAWMTSAEGRMERKLGVFGSDVTNAVGAYSGDVDQWNAEVSHYRDDLLTNVSTQRKTEKDANKLAQDEEAFRVDASGSEEALDGILKRMRAHADEITNAPLRDAFNDLTAVFSDELSGIHLVTRGFVNDDQALIKSGNTRFEDATQRIVDLFDDRVRPIFTRGDIDPAELSRSISELRDVSP